MDKFGVLVGAALSLASILFAVFVFVSEVVRFITHL